MVIYVTETCERSSNSWQVLTEQAHRLLELVAALSGGTCAVEKGSNTFCELNSSLMRAEKFMRSHGRDLLTVSQTQQPQAPEMIIAEAAVIRNSLITLYFSMHQEMMVSVNSSLERLRAAATVEEFARILPSEVVHLGYVRAMFSWVDRMKWVAHAAHSIQGQEECDLVVAAGRKDPLRDLRHFFEVEMIQSRRPILKRNIRTSGRVHPEIMNVAQADAYIASPLVVSGHVKGFVGVDANQKTGTVDQFDRDLLGIFTAGAGIALERLLVLESYATAPSGGKGCFHEGPSSLTPREIEILELLSAGQTNIQIAEELFITEGTAKTHVRNVLRKLGVSNRTQAAALYRRQNN